MTGTASAFVVASARPAPGRLGRTAFRCLAMRSSPTLNTACVSEVAEDVIVGGGFRFDGSTARRPGWPRGRQHDPPQRHCRRVRRRARVSTRGRDQQRHLRESDRRDDHVGERILAGVAVWCRLVDRWSEHLGEDVGTLANRIFDNGEGVRATGDSYGTVVAGNIIEGNLTGATLASVRGLTIRLRRIFRPRIRY